METFQQIEENRDVLFNLACTHKLSDQSVLYNYLFRENHSMKLESTYNQLTAMKVLFGALTATHDKEKVAQMTPPTILEGKLLEENMHQILTEIHKTGLLRLVGIRLRNNEIRNELKKQVFHQTKANKMIKPVMGLVNQATKHIFGFTYKSAERMRSEGRQYSTWHLTYGNLLDGIPIDVVAKRSLLCTDTKTPGHPPVPNPIEVSCTKAGCTKSA